MSSSTTAAAAESESNFPRKRLTMAVCVCEWDNENWLWKSSTNNYGNNEQTSKEDEKRAFLMCVKCLQAIYKILSSRFDFYNGKKWEWNLNPSHTHTRTPRWSWRRTGFSFFCVHWNELIFLNPWKNLKSERAVNTTKENALELLSHSHFFLSLSLTRNCNVFYCVCM